MIKNKVKTITFYKGLKFAEHKLLSKNLESEIFFAHLYSPLERGMNENPNGLIRYYFHKHTDFNEFSESDITLVANRFNKHTKKHKVTKHRVSYSRE
ncbi:IS30 family transposase [Xenorhabdus sp. M]|uniref:IS30 family transposase n=1 Tax=Xenorhabdus szentirmaii TaxID=290112 RepID=A0AAW3YX10_9GAMM|nr:IS30 family transposase [Xenorhabdus sp. M]MBD2803426.1 IS30 family transposase [Xenorhabdus sp. ZM]